ncbi:hypothetical protein V6N11_024542 [Hibiscus sabdariffa]|uniref:ATPase AAA-type core domain-containing protein n=1 Tax=Hibiscus sabdariffa TaxID=183260 RepID=A0ABR2QMH0_9ROSI
MIRLAGETLMLRTFGSTAKYASHFKVSVVKILECNSLESLRGISFVEAKDRQDMIDSALHKYFEVDRYLTSGDVFNIFLNWNCNSAICIPCCARLLNQNDNTIYFKTALVLGGSVLSVVPPDFLISGTRSFYTFARGHGEGFSISFSLKFRVSVLLHSLPGCGKRRVVRYVVKRLGLHVIEYSCHDLTTSFEKKTSAALTKALNSSQRRCFSHEVKMGPLTEEQRTEMLFQSLQGRSDTCLEDFVNDMVGQTSRFMPRDLCALVVDTGANFQTGKAQSLVSDDSIKAVQDTSSNVAAHSRKALERSKKRNASALGAPKVSFSVME